MLQCMFMGRIVWLWLTTIHLRICREHHFSWHPKKELKSGLGSEVDADCTAYCIDVLHLRFAFCP